MIGYADRLDKPILRKGNQHGRPTLHIVGIVYPVNVDMIRIQALETALQHLTRGIRRIPCDMRRKFGGDDDIPPIDIPDKTAKYLLRAAVSIYGSSVPEVQSALKRLIKYGLQVLRRKMIAENRVSARIACSPRPCPKSKLWCFSVHNLPPNFVIKR